MTTELESIEIFLQTLTQDPTLKVQSINDQREVKFASSRESLTKIRTLLADPNLFKDFLITTSQEEELKEPEQQLVVDENISRILNLSGSDLLGTILSQEYLDSQVIFNLEELEAQKISSVVTDDEVLKTHTIEFSAAAFRNLGIIRPYVVRIQSILNNPAAIANSLLQNQPMDVEDINDEELEFGQDIFTINEDKARKTVAVTFNFGKLIRIISPTNPILNNFPMISVTNPQAVSGSSLEATVSLNSLLLYMHQIDPKGLIFRSEENGQLRPIAHQPVLGRTAAQKATPEFFLLLDRSDSMASSFDEYKQKLCTILGEIDKNTNSKWSIELILFNHQVDQGNYIFNSDAYDIDDVIEAINSPLFMAYGGTDINTPLTQVLNNVKARKNPNVILFTDGQHCDANCKLTKQDVLSTALEARSVNPQLAMYTMGFGQEYNQGFFDSLNQYGFRHFHLSKLAEIKDHFLTSLKTMANFKVMYEFLADSLERLQCPEGTVVVSERTIPQNARITIDNHVAELETPEARTAARLAQIAEGAREVQLAEEISESEIELPDSDHEELAPASRQRRGSFVEAEDRRRPIPEQSPQQVSTIRSWANYLCGRTASQTITRE